jgi:hypothetical protein
MFALIKSGQLMIIPAVPKIERKKGNTVNKLYDKCLIITFFRCDFRCKPKEWWSSIAPFCQGLLLGALTCGVVLAIVLTLWLTSSTNNKTSNVRHFDSLNPRLWKAKYFFACANVGSIDLATLYEQVNPQINYFFHRTLTTVEGKKISILRGVTPLAHPHTVSASATFVSSRYNDLKKKKKFRF